MYSFEGEFRKRPNQSLRGASKKEERHELISRTQDQRRQRELVKLQHQSCLKIQSFYRGSKIRETVKNVTRVAFDDCSKRLADASGLNILCRQLIFFYSLPQDEARLSWLGQQMVRHRAAMAKAVSDKTGNALFLLKRILALCCKQLVWQAPQSCAIAAPLRMLEVYTDVRTYQQDNLPETRVKEIITSIISFLMKSNYYGCMRCLIEGRVPDNLEPSANPPTPMASALLDLIRQPLHLTASLSLHARCRVLISLCEEILSQPHTEQVSHFLLPALRQSDPPFPALSLIQALSPACRPCSDQQKDVQLTTQPTIWMMISVLTLVQPHLDQFSLPDLQAYLQLLHCLSSSLRPPGHLDTDDEDSDDENYMDLSEQIQGADEDATRQRCLCLIDEARHVRCVVQALREQSTPTLTAACSLCHVLMAHNHLHIHRTRLLYSLAFNPVFLRQLWTTCLSLSVTAVTGSQTPLLQLLSRGIQLSTVDMERFVPLLSVYCSLFSHSLLSLHDAEFYGDDSAVGHSSMPFSLSELVAMSLALRDACLGIIELAHPDTRPALKEDYRAAFQSVGAVQNMMTTQELDEKRHTWAHLFKVMVSLIRQLYSRDSRRPFCPKNHWLAPQGNLSQDKLSQVFRSPNEVFVHRPFGQMSALNTNRSWEDEGPPLSTSEVRNITILTEVPFVVSFPQRVEIFQRLIQQSRHDEQGEMAYLTSGHTINLTVRRSHLYEDAFEKLSPDNEPNMRKRLRVQLTNFAGADEPGIDGGGLFREFLSELLKSAFDPNRGFFRITSDQLIYPNPQSQLLVENVTQHYYFIGRMLGKAIFENMLVELPFASFFLSKLLTGSRGDVDIHHLASLDPEMYKNLLFLKNYTGDVTELGLDFTVVNNDLGEAQVVELKPGGRDLPVNSTNRIQYIHLMADYRLNRQIRIQCSAFRQGLSDVINLDWLRMFDHNELQVLISGASVPIDIEDLKRHTNYSGGYTMENPVIMAFWKVVDDFTDAQKSQLLKFVTSCSRPPLLGFKDLYPAFCIHSGGDEESRLPTASTCMNLLKLPRFHDRQVLRDKLLYAIESNAGFELS